MDFKVFMVQLDKLLDSYQEMLSKSKNNDLSDLSKRDRQSLVTRVKAAVYRITGANSVYSRDIDRVISQNPHLHTHTSSVLGIAQALRDDISDGFIHKLIEIVHADIFADFLEMAKHLCDNNYKDAAAVIAGSTLESHLKKLAVKNNIPIQNGSVPVKTDKINADLAKMNIYTVLDQKNITAWLDLRNKAAHGNYSEYESAQVNMLISGIGDFVIRNPA